MNEENKENFKSSLNTKFVLNPFAESLFLVKDERRKSLNKNIREELNDSIKIR